MSGQRLAGLGGEMPPEAWRSLLIHGAPRRFAHGEALLRQGDPGQYILALIHGLVKVTRTEADGRELVLAVRAPGEILGEIAYLDGHGRSATVTAVGACLAYIVPGDRFRRIIGDFGLGAVVFRHVTSRLREGEEIRSELTSLPPRRRIARVLLRFSPGGCCALSQADIAKAVGLSRSSVAGELAWLRDQRLLATGRGRVTITDRERLAGIADGEIYR